jgi:hypothetical protein
MTKVKKKMELTPTIVDNQESLNLPNYFLDIIADAPTELHRIIIRHISISVLRELENQWANKIMIPFSEEYLIPAENVPGLLNLNVEKRDPFVKKMVKDFVVTFKVGTRRIHMALCSIGEYQHEQNRIRISYNPVSVANFMQKEIYLQNKIVREEQGQYVQLPQKKGYTKVYQDAIFTADTAENSIRLYMFVFAKMGWWQSDIEQFYEVCGLLKSENSVKWGGKMNKMKKFVIDPAVERINAYFEQKGYDVALSYDIERKGTAKNSPVKSIKFTWQPFDISNRKSFDKVYEICNFKKQKIVVHVQELLEFAPKQDFFTINSSIVENSDVFKNLLNNRILRYYEVYCGGLEARGHEKPKELNIKDICHILGKVSYDILLSNLYKIQVLLKDNSTKSLFRCNDFKKIKDHKAFFIHKIVFQ